jgi:hypothetical protein
MFNVNLILSSPLLKEASGRFHYGVIIESLTGVGSTTLLTEQLEKRITPKVLTGFHHKSLITSVSLYGLKNYENSRLKLMATRYYTDCSGM